MEPHDAHELALNRAFEERWQRRLERPRSVAALTALQYRERKKYELAWYKSETIQLTEQIEHLQNRLSFLMDQNTSLNLECQKLRKRVAQLENLCRDQLKNLVSRPSKSSGGSPSTSQTSGAAMIQNIIDMGEDGDDPNEDDDEPEEVPTKKSTETLSERESEDALEKAAADALTSLGGSGKKRALPPTTPTATATVRRGIRIVKQRSPSGKTTIVAAAASTAGQSSGSRSAPVPVVKFSPTNNSGNLAHVASVRSGSGGRSGVSPPQKQRILIPKRLISYSSSGQSAGLRLIQPVSTMPVKMKPSGSDSMAEERGTMGKDSRSGGSSSKRFSSERKSLRERDCRGERPSSPVKTPPEVIISDEGSSDAEAREKRPRSGPRPGIRFSDGRRILAAASSAASSVISDHKETTKRRLHGHSKSSKKSRADHDVS